MDATEILVIEDDPVIVEFLKTGLRYEGYHVLTSGEGLDGITKVRNNPIDFIILDIMLPDMEGFDVCRRIREYGYSIPILMLTVRDDISDRVKGLDSGADDYMTKPFSFEELLARIRVQLRHSGKILKNRLIQSGSISLNIEMHEVLVDGQAVNLTPTEFSLLELFMQHYNRVFTRQTLLNRVLGYEFDGGTNTLDVHISHLRHKINDTTGLIRTIHGVGYGFYPEQV